ncbi:hypothetical protein CEQ90_09700 [Lewinellaceae bacterium SD302]|nr:hypothetical protein CEQ90_09700 [Lewinellaceae bacterium SD302]
MFTGISAQYEAKIFNADYQFTDGIYLSHASWLANTPDLSWEEIDGEMVQLPEDYRVQIAAMRHKNGSEFERVYAMSLDGFPYICVRHDEQKNFHEFAGLRFRGRYAYFRYSRKELTSKMMYAYNPANGRPFRGAEVEREREVLSEVLLHVPSGEQRSLNRQNVYEILDGYSDLQRAVALLAPDDQELRSKLTRAVKLYNEREPLLLPLPPKSE